MIRFYDLIEHIPWYQMKEVARTILLHLFGDTVNALAARNVLSDLYYDTYIFFVEFVKYFLIIWAN